MDKDLEEYEDHVGRILSKSYPTESFNRSTNQLVREESYFNQPMERKIDPSVCDVIMSPDDFENNFMDQDKLDNVSKKRRGSEFNFHLCYKKPKTFNEKKSYYEEADDVAYYDVNSGVSLTRWSEVPRKIPIHSLTNVGRKKNESLTQKWGKSPMPVTFYNREREPFTLI